MASGETEVWTDTARRGDTGRGDFCGDAGRCTGGCVCASDGPCAWPWVAAASMEPAPCTDTARLPCRGEGGLLASLAGAAVGAAVGEAATGRGLCGRRFTAVDEVVLGACLASEPAP